MSAIDDLRALVELNYQRRIQLADVIALARRVKTLADAAWDAQSVAAQRSDDLTAAYEQGKAHAFCQVLGDQAALSQLGVFDQ